MAKQVFTNFKDIEALIKQRALMAMSATMDELREKLLDYVDEYIYNSYTPTFYERTYSLNQEANWQIYKPYLRGDSLYSNIIYGNQKGFPQPMDYIGFSIPLNYQHGNYLFGGLKPYDLIEILDDGEPNDNIFNFPNGTLIHKAHFFSDWKDWVRENYTSIFAKWCNYYGVPVSYGAKIDIVGKRI